MNNTIDVESLIYDLKDQVLALESLEQLLCVSSHHKEQIDNGGIAKLIRGMDSFALKLTQGELDLIPEMPVTVQGFKAEIDSTEWMIVRVTNEVNKDSGFTTGLEMELKVED